MFPQLFALVLPLPSVICSVVPLRCPMCYNALCSQYTALCLAFHLQLRQRLCPAGWQVSRGRDRIAGRVRRCNLRTVHLKAVHWKTVHSKALLAVFVPPPPWPRPHPQPPPPFIGCSAYIEWEGGRKRGARKLRAPAASARHQGWMGGTTRGDDDWMGAELNSKFSADVRRCGLAVLCCLLRYSLEVPLRRLLQCLRWCIWSHFTFLSLSFHGFSRTNRPPTP